MALSKDALNQALRLALREPFPSTTGAAAKKIAIAYDTYAKSAMAGTYPFLPKGTEVRALEKAIAAALRPGLGPGPVVAAAITSGVGLYWTGAVFTPALCAPPPGLTALLTGLSTLFVKNNNNLGEAASKMASLLHACTLTAVATDASTGATFTLL